MSNPNVLKAASGQPYQSKTAAVQAIAAKKLDPATHTPIELADGGWGILVAEAGEPGAAPVTAPAPAPITAPPAAPVAPPIVTAPVTAPITAPPAASPATPALPGAPAVPLTAGLPPPPSFFAQNPWGMMMAHAGGFNGFAQPGAPVPAMPKALVIPPDSYWWVMVSGKRHPNETNYVPLVVNTVIYRLTRGVTLPLSASLVEGLRQTEYTHWEQKPGQPYKTGTKVAAYPFTILGQATREEFEAFMRHGTATIEREQVDARAAAAVAATEAAGVTRDAMQ